MFFPDVVEMHGPLIGMVGMNCSEHHSYTVTANAKAPGTAGAWQLAGATVRGSQRRHHGLRDQPTPCMQPCCRPANTHDWRQESPHGIGHPIAPEISENVWQATDSNMIASVTLTKRKGI